MKKAMQLLAALTSVTLFSAAVIMPMRVNADDNYFVSDTVEPTTAAFEEETNTSYDHRDYEVCYSISFVDSITGKLVDNVEAKLCKIETKYLTGQRSPSGELEIVDGWNSSDESVYTTKWYPAIDDYAYIVIVDELPDGYIYAHQSGLLIRLDSSYQTGEVDFKISLNRGEPDIPRDYPLNGTFSMDIDVKDADNNNIIKNVECELVDEQTGEVLASWNTSEHEKMHFESLEYKFNTRINQETGAKTYAVKIKNMPDDYKIYPSYASGENGTAAQRIGYSMFYIYHHNNKLSFTIPLFKVEDVPIVTNTAATQVSSMLTNTTTESATFYCPDCGRTVPLSERISGPLRSICRDCYEAGHYIGTTASMRTTNTTTTTVTTSDTGLANQTNSTTVTIPPLNADIVFKDEEIMLEVGKEKSFEYTVTGAEYVSFFSISDIRIVNNTFSDGKGVITLKTSRYSWGDDMVCTLRSGEAFVEKLIPVHVAEPTTFYCPDCGRTVPNSERISGPLRSICRDCYEAGHYIGTTAPMRTTNTTTTTVTSSDTGLANQTNSTTVTIDPRSTTAPKELCESGDVNLDGQTTVADAAAILQYIGNRDKYQLTDQGKKNADVDGVKGITPNDALAIMKWDSFENR